MPCRSAFRTLGQLQEAHPHNGGSVAFTPMLAMLVDALASSVESVDSGYYVLEEMHAQVGHSPASDCGGKWDCLWVFYSLRPCAAITYIHIGSTHCSTGLQSRDLPID